jgi:hypothetical protein
VIWRNAADWLFLSNRKTPAMRKISRVRPGNFAYRRRSFALASAAASVRKLFQPETKIARTSEFMLTRHVQTALPDN